jgi:hypothetical protein
VLKATSLIRQKIFNKSLSVFMKPNTMLRCYICCHIYPVSVVPNGKAISVVTRLTGWTTWVRLPEGLCFFPSLRREYWPRVMLTDQSIVYRGLFLGSERSGDASEHSLSLRPIRLNDTIGSVQWSLFLYRVVEEQWNDMSWLSRATTVLQKIIEISLSIHTI